MKKILLLVAGLIGLFVVFLGVKQINQGMHEMSGTSSMPPQKLGETYTSTEPNYSFRIPEGWQSKPGPQPGMTTISAPPESGLSANMVITAETFPGSLNDYVEANKKALQNTIPNVKILSDDVFLTEAKGTAHKVQLHNKMKDVELAQTMYFFDGANQLKIIVTCTAPAKDGPDLASLFDDGMKTFAFSDRS